MVISFAGFVAVEGEAGQPYERVGVTVRKRGWASAVKGGTVVPLAPGEVVKLPIWVFSKTDHTADTQLRFDYTVTVAAFWFEVDKSPVAERVLYYIETVTGHTIDVTDFVVSRYM